MEMQKEVKAHYNHISANFKTNNEKETYKFVIVRGNNSELVRRCMELRSDWEESSLSNTLFNFKW